jgi:hypothetical protein
MLADVEPRVSSPLLVGRSGQLSALDTALAEAGRGSPSAVIVGGEAGVGKSRLVSEFAERSRGANARVLIGGCLELGAEGLPFAAFTAVLRGLVRDLGVAGVAELLPGGASRELARLLPEFGEPAGPDGAGEARARLFEQMLLRRQAQREGLARTARHVPSSAPQPNRKRIPVSLPFWPGHRRREWEATTPAT